MADKPVRYIIEGDASKLKGEFKELASMAKGLSASIKGVKDALAAVKSQSTSPGKKASSTEKSIAREIREAYKQRNDALKKLAQAERAYANLKSSIEKQITADTNKAYANRESAARAHTSTLTAEQKKQVDAVFAANRAAIRATRELATAEEGADRVRVESEKQAQSAIEKSIARHNKKVASEEKRIGREIELAHKQRIEQKKQAVKKEQEIEAAYTSYMRAKAAERASAVKSAYAQAGVATGNGLNNPATIEAFARNRDGIRASRDLIDAEDNSIALALSEQEKQRKAIEKSIARHHKRVEDEKKRHDREMARLEKANLRELEKQLKPIRSAVASGGISNLGLTAMPGTLSFALARQRAGFGSAMPPIRPPGDDPLAGLTASERTQSRLDALVGKTAKVAKNTGDIGKGATNAGRAFDEFGRRSNNVLANTARRIKDVVTALIIFDTLRALRDGIRDTFSFITEANQKIEDSRIGIASTITAAGEFVDTFGKALPIAQQVNIALSEADALIPKLLEVSAGRGLNFDTLLQTQTATAGFTKAAGFTPEQTVETIAAVSFFSEKIGVSQSRIVKTLDNIIKGYRVQQTELGTALGLDSKQIEAWRQKGVLAENLLDLLKGTAEAQKQNLDTLTGIKNALNTQKTILARQVSGGFFDKIKEAYTVLKDGIAEIGKSPEKVENIANLLEKVGASFLSAAESIVAASNLIASIKFGKPKETLPGDKPPGIVAAFPGMFAPGAQVNIQRQAQQASAAKAMLSGIDSSLSSILDATVTLPGNGVLDTATYNEKLKQSRKENFFGLGTVLAPADFDPREQTGGSDKKKSGRVRERTLEQAVNERAEFVRREEDSLRARLESLAQMDEKRLSDAQARLDISESELSILEAQDRPLSELLKKQQGIFDLSLAQIDLEQRLAQERIGSLQAEIDRGVSQELEFNLKSEIYDLERKLNELATERIVLTNENTAAIERQIRSQSESASTLGDIIKGLRDGASFDDILGDIGRRSADKFIDNFLTQKLNVLDPAIEGNFTSVIPDAMVEGGKKGVAGLGGLFSGAAAGGGNVVRAPDGTFYNVTDDGPSVPLSGFGQTVASIGSGLGQITQGASFGAGIGSLSASIAAAAGASRDKQLAMQYGSLAGGAVGGVAGGAIGGASAGSVAGPIGAAIGAIVGIIGGTLFNDAFLNPPVPGFVKDRESIANAFKESGIFPTLALAKNPRDGRFYEQGALPGTAPTGSGSFYLRFSDEIRELQPEFDALYGALNLVLKPENRGILGTRATQLGLTQEQALREVRKVAQESTNLEDGIAALTNRFLRYAQEGKGAVFTQEEYNKRLASTIKLLSDFPGTIDFAALANASLMDFGQQQIADIEELTGLVDQITSITETGFVEAIQRIAEGSNLRDAVDSLSESYSNTLIDSFSKKFLESSISSPKFTEAIIKGNEAIDALLAGDTGLANSLLRDSLVALNDANIESAGLLADYSPFLRDINQSYGGAGIVMPLGASQGNEEVTALLQQINDNLSQGRSVSVYAQTQGGNFTISSREISDAERNATARQSSGSRRPDPMVGVRT